MVLAALRDDSYNVVLLLHIAAVIVAFAPVIAGVVQQLGLGADADSDIARRLAAVQQKTIQSVSMGALVVALLTGLGMIFMSDDVIEFSDGWISMAFGLWIIIAGLISGMVGKGERQKAAGDGKGRDLVLAGSGVALTLALVALSVMIYMPGA